MARPDWPSSEPIIRQGLYAKIILTHGAELARYRPQALASSLNYLEIVSHYFGERGAAVDEQRIFSLPQRELSDLVRDARERIPPVDAYLTAQARDVTARLESSLDEPLPEPFDAAHPYNRILATVAAHLSMRAVQRTIDPTSDRSIREAIALRNEAKELHERYTDHMKREVYRRTHGIEA